MVAVVKTMICNGFGSINNGDINGDGYNGDGGNVNVNGDGGINSSINYICVIIDSSIFFPPILPSIFITQQKWK